jgi:hypothetical protein
MMLQVLATEQYSAGLDTDATADYDPTEASQPQPQPVHHPAADATSRENQGREREVDRAQCVQWNLGAARQYVRESHRDELTANWDAFRARHGRERRRGEGVRGFGRVDETIRNFMNSLSETQAAVLAVVSAARCVLATGRAYKHIDESVHAEMRVNPGLWPQYRASVATMPAALTRGARLVVVANAINVPCAVCFPRLTENAASVTPPVTFRRGAPYTYREERADLADAPARLVADWFRSAGVLPSVP